MQLNPIYLVFRFCSARRMAVCRRLHSLLRPVLSGIEMASDVFMAIIKEVRNRIARSSAPVAKYPPLQRPSRRFARYAAHKERAVLTDASAPGEALI